MSLTAVKPYFQNKFSGLGFTEWVDPFGKENIPSNVIDRSFHIEIGTIQGVVKSNLSQEFEVPIIVSVFFKGFREPEKAIDEALVKAEAAIIECMKFENFVDSDVSGVFVQSVELLPLDDQQNDNVVVAVISFAARAHLCVE